MGLPVNVRPIGTEGTYFKEEAVHNLDFSSWLSVQLVGTLEKSTASK